MGRGKTKRKHKTQKAPQKKKKRVTKAVRTNKMVVMLGKEKTLNHVHSISREDEDDVYGGLDADAPSPGTIIK